MCGICGSVALTDGGRVDADRVSRMLSTLRHRGPDEQGLHVEPGIGLAASRLAIIDPDGGHQPVQTEDGAVRAVLNGEIYNYRDLRERLVGRGHRLVSHGDTEVLVHLYEERGLDFLQDLRGMFAIALWDGRLRRLVLARDRLGVKPLFWAVADGCLHFGSEIKAVLAAGVPPRLDGVALHDYLSFNYVPGPRTMFDGVRRLPAGHVLVAGPGTAATEHRYWDFPPQPEHHAEGADDEEALAAELEARLADAVRATMESDVPVGAFLSGGLDSSLVVAMMARHSASSVHTFSVGFRERSYDELPYAREVSRAFGTRHTEIVLEPSVDGMLGRLLDAFDEPFADSSAVATWMVSQAAAGHVKVVLSGDGGDEVFGGYVIYQADQLRSLYGRLPEWFTGRVAPWLVDRLPASDRKMSLELRARRFVENGRSNPARAHAGWRAVFTDEMKGRLYAPAYGPPARDSLAIVEDAVADYPGTDLLNRLMVADARISLVDDMLTKVDRTSMAHGLEVRVPLLDHALVEWMTVVPSRHKVRRLRLKVLLRRVAAGVLPPGVVSRPKAGFHVPVPVWLKRELRPVVEAQLDAETVRRQGVFDPIVVERLVGEHLSGRRDHSRNLWALLLFGLWVDRALGGRA